MSTNLQANEKTIPNNIQGILWALVSSALFAIVTILTKVAVTEYHVLQILFFRQMIVLLSSLPSIASTFPHSLKTKHPGIHALRLTGAFVALSCGIWAVSILPLTTAITLGFSKVFFVALLAMLFLHEFIGKHRAVAILIGFIGIVLVMRPSTQGLFNISALIPIAGAFGAAIAAVSVRKLSQTESTATLLVYQAIVVGAMAGIPLFWLWMTPDLKGTLLLILMGVLATAANWIGVKALRLGEASIVGNIDYIQLVYAAILGYLLFSEVPDIYTIMGATIIIGSSIYIFRRESLSNKRSE